MVSSCKISPHVQARQDTSICCFCYSARKNLSESMAKWKWRFLISFFKGVLIEKQSHVFLAALPTDSKRRWDGLFSCAGRIKFLNPALPPPKPLYLWDLEEPKSSTGKLNLGSAFHGRSSPPGDGVSLGASSPENRTTGFHLLFLLATLCCLHRVGMGWLSPQLTHKQRWCTLHGATLCSPDFVMIFNKGVTTAALRLLAILAIRNFSMKSGSAWFLHLFLYNLGRRRCQSSIWAGKGWKGPFPTPAPGKGDLSSAFSSSGTAGPASGSSSCHRDPSRDVGISAAKHLAPSCAPRVYGRRSLMGSSPAGATRRESWPLCISSWPAGGAETTQTC